jgi:glycosyltransferase involved in cell wall biosynthesis
MIWIDVTEIKNWEGHYTGIQRVISKIGNELMASGDNFATCYFDYATNVFRVIEYSFNTEVIYNDEPLTTRQLVSRKLITKAKAIKRRAPERLKGPIKSATRILSAGNVKDTAVSFTPEDTLFIPGAFWIYPIERLERLKQKGIHLSGVIYDLVPLVVPQYTAKVTVDGFGARFKKALNVFDSWFAISENTKHDMIQQAKKQGIEVDDEKVTVIRLGIAIGSGDHYEAKMPENFPFKSNEFSLFVSTIEARKNQALLYQAVKRLQEQGIKHTPIVLVGKHGWLSDDIVYILRNDPTIRGTILWLDHVDDRALQWLYVNCRFTIYPSYYEGWGLPVAESLARGKPCIASNTSSIPEVGGDLVEYFSPFSVDELAGLLKKYSDQGWIKSRLNLVANYNAPNWKTCAEHVRALLEAG